jgi:hypothetical protein
VFYIQSGLDLLRTAADIVRLYTFCITYNKDWYVRLNRGYLFALWRNLQRRKLDTHSPFTSFCATQTDSAASHVSLLHLYGVHLTKMSVKLGPSNYLMIE